ITPARVLVVPWSRPRIRSLTRPASCSSRSRAGAGMAPALLPQTRVRLERQPRPEDDDAAPEWAAVTAGQRGDAAVVRAREIRLGDAEVRVVGDVLGLDLDPQRRVAVDPEVLEQPHVDRVEPRSRDAALLGVAEAAREDRLPGPVEERGVAERPRVEPLVRRLRPAVGVLPGDRVRLLRVVAVGARSAVAAVERREMEARLRGHDARERPSPQGPVALEERQLPDEGGRETMIGYRRDLAAR